MQQIFDIPMLYLTFQHLNYILAHARGGIHILIHFLLRNQRAILILGSGLYCLNNHISPLQ